MKHLDTIGWYIANLHQLLGHDRAAAAIGCPAGVKELCILCAYERGEATRQDVINQIGVEVG